MYYNTKKNKKTKVRSSRLLRHPAWKWRAPILVLALDKFVAYLLRHLPTYLQLQTHKLLGVRPAVPKANILHLWKGNIY